MTSRSGDANGASHDRLLGWHLEVEMPTAVGAHVCHVRLVADTKYTL